MSDGRSNWEDALPRFSLRRRVTVLVVLATALVVGALATNGIPLELLPRGFEEPYLQVEAPWRDVPANEVLDKVVLPLEEELSTVTGLKELSSYSQTGYGEIFLDFKQGTDMDIAYREVRDRIERARARMPSDVEQIRIDKEDGSGIPVMVLGVAADPDVTDLYELVQNHIITPLSRVDGVAAVRSDGLQQKEIVVELDRALTTAAGLNIYEVAQELGADNFSMASGTVLSGRKKLLLRSLARFESIEELGARLVTPNIRLREIATVKYAMPEQSWRVRVNSKPALAVNILKEGQANTIEVSRGLRDAYKKIQQNPRLQGSDTAVLFDQGEVILDSLWTLIDSGEIGGLFAVLVLFFFLRRFRITLIIALAIPVSMLLAITVMYFVGESLNILSLLGLMICVGLLVDNSVVVAENIQGMYQRGMSRQDACIRGAGEIALAVTLATLTTIVVFLPMSLVDGKAQFFLLRLSVPICVSLLASLAVALIFVPLCVYLTLGEHGTDRGPSSRLGRLLDRWLEFAYDITFAWLNRAYTTLLAFFLRRRTDLVLLIVSGYLATCGIAFRGVDVVGISEEDRRSFSVRTEMPRSYTLEDAETFFARVEAVLARYKTEMGLEGYMVVHTGDWGRIRGWFPASSTLSQRQIVEGLMKRLPEEPGVEYFSASEKKKENDEKKETFTLSLHGEDPAVLEEVGRSVEQQLTGVEGVLSLQRSKDRVPNEVGLVVDSERAQKIGANPRVIAGVVGYSLRGQTLPRFHQEGREIPARIRFREADRQSLSELADFQVPITSGDTVPLSAVTSVKFLRSATGIYRQNKRISYRIQLDLDDGTEKETRKRLGAAVSSIDLPEGIRFGTQVVAASEDEDLEAMKFAGIVSIILIYLLMGFLFESFILPLSIILTIPLASIGVGWLHYGVGRDIDFLGVVGGVLLVGIVVNNGIVLIDYVTRLREQGHERTEALLLAAKRRFRPILMTAGTTICGLVPLTVGEASSIGLSYKSFGLTLIGGLITATAFTLLVIPVFYTLFDDARGAVRTAVSRTRNQ